VLRNPLLIKCSGAGFHVMVAEEFANHQVVCNITQMCKNSIIIRKKNEKGTSVQQRPLPTFSLFNHKDVI